METVVRDGNCLFRRFQQCAAFGCELIEGVNAYWERMKYMMIMPK
jgi:hypothetical protein